MGGDRRPEGGEQQTGSRLHLHSYGKWGLHFQWQNGMKCGDFPTKFRLPHPSHAPACCDAARTTYLSVVPAPPLRADGLRAGGPPGLRPPTGLDRRGALSSATGR
ncbi:hypothetical protein ADP8_05205 (plasmid) [Roseomonas mucosa]|nr:hypothetical protein ADP8_05205 [Roseomonas mucosa]